MCGIAGIFLQKRPVERSMLVTLSQGLAHRGPDAEGIWCDGPVGFVHRRLSIIDTSDASNQPLFDNSRQFAMVFNGEIYNYKPLRSELQSKGAVFLTQGDGEVLLEAYKYWGQDCVNKIEGMFAFAIWDMKEQTIFCARDRMGKKPFFYSMFQDADGGGFAFSSEPRALSMLPGVRRDVDINSLHKYIALGYSIGKDTLWQGIKRLSPGHTLFMKRAGAAKIREFYDFLPAFSQKTGASFQEASEQLWELLNKCVEDRMQSDVPFGAFLSAGLDSNSVLSSMKSIIGPEKVQSFTIGFSEKSYDESSVAAEAAQAMGISHKTFLLDPEKIDLDRILDKAGEEPLADASFIATYCLSQYTRQDVKMVLTGDGGDELFAGYPTYIANKIHRTLSPILPSFAWGGAHKLAEGILPVSFKRMSFEFKVKQFLRGLAMDAPRAHFSWRVLMSDQGLGALFNQDVHRSSIWENVYSEFEPHFKKASHLSPLDQTLYVDAKTWMVDSVLVKVDRASMAHGLEARSPFLDHKMVEFAASLPESYKLSGVNKKRILKNAARPHIPGLIFNQKKRGFSVPVSYWMDRLIEANILEIKGSSFLASIFDQNTVSRLVEEHRARARNHGLTLLNIIILSKWLKQQNL